MKYKITTIYDNLKPEFKAELNINARKYSSAKRLKYALMSKTSWQDLAISELSSMTTYCDISSFTLSVSNVLYGHNIIK